MFLDLQKLYTVNRCHVSHQLTFSSSGHPKLTLSFHRLKYLFSSVPVLIHPISMSQFIVKVDTLSTSFGAVLSQGNPKDQKVF